MFPTFVRRTSHADLPRATESDLQLADRVMVVA